MSIHLIIDSCCDLTPEMKDGLRTDVAPLKVQVVDGHEYLDDGTVNIPDLLRDMADSKQGAKSACPSTEEYAQHMRLYDECFVVTLSSKLSGSFNAARIAAEDVMEEFPQKKIHVFDSQTASAGEVQLALFLHEKIQEGRSFDEIIPAANDYIASMRTYFILEDLGNFIKNGRMGKVTGLIASALSLCPIMGENGQGDIRLVAKVRGIKNSYRKLVELIAEQTTHITERSVRMVICHCNCPERAAELKQNVMEKCKAIREIVVTPTGALSSMYANNGGIIVAF